MTIRTNTRPKADYISVGIFPTFDFKGSLGMFCDGPIGKCLFNGGRVGNVFEVENVVFGGIGHGI